MTEKKYMTVVLEYTEEDNRLPKMITSMLGSDQEFMGSKITAVSMIDEISYSVKLQEQLDDIYEENRFYD